MCVCVCVKEKRRGEGKYPLKNARLTEEEWRSVDACYRKRIPLNP